MSNDIEKKLEQIYTDPEQFPLIKFSIFLILFILLIKPIFNNYNPLVAIHLSLLTWSFFVLCMPISRGKVLITKTFKFLFNKKIKYPELFTWLIALTINMFTLAISGTPYIKTSVTHLLYLILQTPWPLWIVIVVCGIATFFNSFFCSNTYKKNIILNLTCRVLILISFFTTLLLTYKEIVIILNTPTFR